jgi:hypothetical protein
MNRKDESSVPVISSTRHAALRAIAPPLIGPAVLGVGMSLRALDTDKARWNFALCTLKGQIKRRLRSRFPTAHPMDAQLQLRNTRNRSQSPREFLTPEIWQGLIEGWYECEELDEIAAALRPNDVVRVWCMDPPMAPGTGTA